MEKSKSQSSIAWWQLRNGPGCSTIEEVLPSWQEVFTTWWHSLFNLTSVCLPFSVVRVFWLLSDLFAKVGVASSPLFWHRCLRCSGKSGKWWQHFAASYSTWGSECEQIRWLPLSLPQEDFQVGFSSVLDENLRRQLLHMTMGAVWDSNLTIVWLSQPRLTDGSKILWKTPMQWWRCNEYIGKKAKQ